MNVAHRTRRSPGAHRQHGAVLLVSAIFLLVLGLIAVAAMQTSRTELRMAGNEELRINANQHAQALVDAVVATPAMTPVIGGAGSTMCTPNITCDRQTLFMPDADLNQAVLAGHLSGQAVATDPSNTTPPRGLGFSADKFSATGMQIQTTYDRSADGLGYAQLTQGLVILIPNQ